MTTKSRNFGVPGVIAGLVLVGLVAGAVYVMRQVGRNTDGTPQSQPAGLISDNGIVFGGMPRATRPESTFTVLKNIAYIVGYSESRKDPLWSAYHLVHVENPYHLDRPKGNFLTDERTGARVTHHDFTGSGYDRGHMTPNSAIAHCFGHDAQVETFLLSNICPQAANLNQKVWESLEKEELGYADRFGEIWVIDGPIFADLNGGTTRTLRAGIAVPESFYKILIENKGGNVEAFAVIMPQTARGTELPSQFVTSIEEIEKRTGLEFLWKLDSQTAGRLKSKVAAQW